MDIQNINTDIKLKILIIRMSSMGDVILTFPFIRLLRKWFPDAQIDYVVKKKYEEIVQSNKYISNIYSFDSTKGFCELRKLKKKIKNERYTYIFDIHRNLRSYYLRKFSSAKKVFLYKKYRIKRWFLINLNINLYNTITPVYKAYIGSAKKIGLTDDEKGFDFKIDDVYLNKANTLLRGIDSNKLLVAVCPGTGHENKSWTVDGFSKVAKFLVSKFNSEIIVIGDRKDFDKGETIKEFVGDGVRNYCGSGTIMDSAALISRCDVVITNDAGPMHIAEALNKKIVAIFGPTVEEFGYFPVNTNAVIVQRDCFCRPCSNNGWKKCYKKERECLEEIGYEAVINAFLNLISNSNGIKGNKEYFSKCKDFGFSYIDG